VQSGSACTGLVARLMLGGLHSLHCQSSATFSATANMATTSLRLGKFRSMYNTGGNNDSHRISKTASSSNRGLGPAAGIQPCTVRCRLRPSDVLSPV